MPIGFVCATSAKYDQNATLLRQGYSEHDIEYSDEVLRGEVDHPLAGGYVTKQHPITGEYIREWKSLEELYELTPDEDVSGETNPQPPVLTFPCQARSIITGGLNSQGTTERWTTKGSYENIDFIEMVVPKNILITKRDRITGITNSRGEVVWREEEHGKFTPTVFDVRGVAPSLDPFGSLVEWFILCERAQIQGGKEIGKNE